MMTDSGQFIDVDDCGSDSNLPLPVELGDEVPHEETTADLTGDVTPGKESSFTPRAYQLEMLGESLRRNIIVAMDTGSGKTHIAVLRIIHELENGPPEKIVWFLAPTVSLCIQQHALFESEISQVQIRLLQGNDGVDKWKSQKIWDFALKNVRIVVSTPQVLLDALTHAFVRLDIVSLLVLDEVHNCVGKSAGNMIMQNFYRPRKAQGHPVPHILGLSASPVMNSKVQSVQRIEEAMDAICRTPKKHRAELLQHVEMPEFRQMLYMQSTPAHELAGSTRSLSSLHSIYIGYDINKDPYIIHLRAENSEKSKRELERLLMKQKTWCFDQLKSFCATSLTIYRELGAWSADYYISQVVRRFTRLDNLGNSYFETWTSNEKQHLCELLKQVELSDLANETPTDMPVVSDKVKQLIGTLSRDRTSAGIVFVQQRATVAVLAQLLSIHPHTRTLLRVGTMVGASDHCQRSASISELIDPKEQRQTLYKFRNRELDLVIATSVLEEGIDIPVCNIVICFDPPANLKSFVQRRGRARMKKSKLVLMLPSISDKLGQWQQLEAEMKNIYANDMRELRAIAEIEDLEEHDGHEFRVESTGALLNLDNAVQHLYHFCALLPASECVDLRPEFIFAENQPTTVLLPLCVDAAVRVAHSRKSWLSERNGKKDAAFEAYLALYKAGLVNDNLMPLLKDEELATGVEKRPSMVEANARVDPWIEVARAWTHHSGTETHKRASVTLNDAGHETLIIMEMMLPVDIPPVDNIRLYWDATTELTVTIKPSYPSNLISEDDLQQAQDFTWAILNAAFGWRFPIVRSKFITLFTSVSATLERGSNPVSSASQISRLWPRFALIRDKTDNDQPYIFEEWLDHKPAAIHVKHLYKDYEEVPEDIAHLAVSKLSRRADFLHKVPPSNQPPSTKHFSYVLPETRCVLDETPFILTQFAMLMPSILHRLELYMVGGMLSKTVLTDVKFNNLNLVVMAISASSAMEDVNYQRLEFLGDSLLKFCTSLQLLAEYPLWHEGYLSSKKDQIVANSRLARAALQVGLDKFIVTKSFTGRKWRPLYVQDLLDSGKTVSKREISSKILADVVEALIGAAKIDGGMPKVLACMRVFLPEVNWQSLEDRRASVFKMVTPDVILPPPLRPLEDLIGYSFKKKALLVEAMTHASCNIGTSSLERLEFLGDAVLDTLIVNAIYNQEIELSHVKMHHLRAAFVNADFLAFMCMEWAIEQERGVISENKITHTFRTSTSTVSLALSSFMRRGSQALSTLQLETSRRHLALRDDINAALASGSYYPWALLCRLQAPKFFSDIVESLLGAVYVDAGSLDACEGVIERMGILPYLRRAIRDDVHNLHPKEELGILADTEKVKYVVAHQNRSAGSADKRAYTCEVFVGERSIVLVSEGANREEVTTKAAEAAVKVLKERGRLDRESFNLELDKIVAGDAMNTT